MLPQEKYPVNGTITGILLKLFGEGGYKATMKELDANLIGRNVIDMLMFL
jgi:hypothetical protein